MRVQEAEFFHELPQDKPWTTVSVRKQYLLDHKEGFWDVIGGKLQSVWSYPGHQPTFNVLLDDGSIFSYLPAAAFEGGFYGTLQWPLWTHCGIVCPSKAFIYYESKTFEDRNLFIHCFSPEKKYLGAGNYCFTIEWPYENENLHFMEIGSNYFFIPNHKMLLTKDIQEPKLPSWKKLNSEWKR